MRKRISTEEPLERAPAFFPRKFTEKGIWPSNGLFPPPNSDSDSDSDTDSCTMQIFPLVGIQTLIP